MPELDAAGLARELAPYNLSLSSAQLQQVQTYLDLLLRWNRRINLTAIRDPRRIIRELFGESMYLGTILPLCGQLIDIGSGAGFPGLALKLLQPQLAVTLVEANQRKCTFLQEAAFVLHMSGVDVLPARVEETAEQLAGRFDIATTRAVAVDAPLVRDLEGVLRSGGVVAVFSSAGVASRIEVLESGFRWDRPVQVPDSSKRVILLGRKME